MEIFQFEQFQMIAECGTMREAAERLFLSQSTLSHNLKKLEAELGCKLFARAGNQLRLTPYGELVLERTRELRAIVPIDEPIAKRNIGLLYRPDAPEKVLAFVKHMKSHATGVFSGNAFIPYFLFPEDVSNLSVNRGRRSVHANNGPQGRQAIHSRERSFVPCSCYP